MDREEEDVGKAWGMWEKEGKGGLEMGRRVQTEREYGRRKKRRETYLSVRRTQGEETCSP